MLGHCQILLVFSSHFYFFCLSWKKWAVQPSVTCGIFRAKHNILRLHFPKVSWRSLCLSFSLQCLYWVMPGMWKAIWENLSGCGKVSGFEILWSMLANAHSIFQGVWLPLLWVRMWRGVRGHVLLQALLSWCTREEIPRRNKLQWHLLVLVQLKVSPHLQNMISNMARNAGVTPFPPQPSSKIPV